MKIALLTFISTLFFISVEAQCNFNIEIEVINPASCTGVADGVLSANVSGQFFNGSYFWLPTGITTPTANNLNEGWHTVFVTDSAGCQIADSIYLGNITTNQIVFNTACFSCNDGAIYLSPLNGVAPFTFDWSNNEQNYFVSGVDTGIYTCHVVDSAGCDTYLVEEVKSDSSLSDLVSGSIFLDSDSNGIFSPGDYGMNNVAILLMPDSILSYTNSFGNFYFGLSTGNYSIYPLINSLWEINSDSLSYNFTFQNQLISGLNFGLNPSIEKDSLAVFISTQRVGCFRRNSSRIKVFNAGTTTMNCLLEYIPDSSFVNIVSTPGADSIINAKYYWNIDNLMPSKEVSFIVNQFVNAPAFTPFKDLVNLYNNSNLSLLSNDSIGETVRCSFDPNDKSVLPQGADSLHYTLKNERLRYHINFQNTGNDTAFSVRITDYIDANLDLASFEFICSSHYSYFTLNNFTRELETAFPNILLPDSGTNEAASKGFFEFEISPLDNLADSTQITNEASIYFDMNSPIVTNQTLNTLVSTIPLTITNFFKNSVLVYPNPAKNNLNVDVSSQEKIKEVKLLNMAGQEILKRAVDNIEEKLRIDVSEVSSGVYLLQILSDKTNVIKLIIINNSK
jgi:uncharacterized repeat protein (TIGR01451 family)